MLMPPKEVALRAVGLPKNRLSWQDQDVPLDPTTIDAFVDELQKLAAEIVTDREQIKRLLKPGDILYTRPAHIDKTLHKAFYEVGSRIQGSPYTHVGLYAGDGHVIDAGAWRKGNGESAEVHKIPIDRFLDRYKFKVLRVNTSAGQKAEAVDYAKDQVGKKFNFKGMLRLVLPFQGEVKGERAQKDAAESFFCSELVANAYENVGFAKKKHLHHVMPKDIYKSPKTKTVAQYEGEEKSSG